MSPTGVFYIIQRSKDCLLEILLYLHISDAFTFALTCKELLSIFLPKCHDMNEKFNEQLWYRYCGERIQGLQHKLPDQMPLLDLRKELNIPTYFAFFRCFRYILRPLFGWYRLIPHSTQLFRGGLYKLTASSECSQSETRQSFRMAYESTEGYLIGRIDAESNRDSREPTAPFLSKVDYRITINRGGSLSLQVRDEYSAAMIWNMLDYLISFQSRNSFRGYELQPLPLIADNHSFSNLLLGGDLFSLRKCLGLFCASYGSHGKEILHISLQSRTSTEDVDADSPFYNYDTELNFIGSKLLYGLKITGDPNVPAGKLSFIIDVECRVDINRLLIDDDRPVIAFPSVHAAPILLDLGRRVQSMDLVAMGYGQTNQNPAVWDPEWMRCYFILYKESIEGVGSPRAVFSILWNDDGSPYRHIFDFDMEDAEYNHNSIRSMTSI